MHPESDCELVPVLITAKEEVTYKKTVMMPRTQYEHLATQVANKGVTSELARAVMTVFLDRHTDFSTIGNGSIVDFLECLP